MMRMWGLVRGWGRGWVIVQDSEGGWGGTLVLYVGVCGDVFVDM